MNPFYYMAFDPGEKSSGLATFNDEGTLTGVYSIKNGLKGVIEWWEVNVPGTPKIPHYQTDIPEVLPQVVICETYRIKDFQFKHHWAKVPTIRVIGVIEGYAYRCGAEFVEQESNAYKSGIKWSGNDVPPGHVPDHLSALGHGVYYLHKVAKKWKIKL